MKDLWTGEIVGKMHVAEVTQEELGRELGIHKSYVSQILSGKRKPAHARERLEAAFDAIMERRIRGD